MSENVFNEYGNILKELIGALFPNVYIFVEAPKDKSFGDLTTNVALTAAKRLKRPPMDIALEIKSIIERDERFVNVSVAKPGFVNWQIDKKTLIRHLESILASEYGKTDIGRGEKVNIEYVSANPTGPLHAGHARGAVVGDALARLLSYVGYDVTKEYYINDAGNQIKILAQSLYHRYIQIAAPEHANDALADFMYPGEYLIDIARELFESYGNQFVGQNEEQWMDIFRNFAVTKIMGVIKQDLEDLGIHHDVFTSEKAVVESGKVDQCIKILQEKGLIYRGVLPAPKGKPSEDWEEREQLLFKSTEFGDTVDRPLQKSDGTWTYFATDIAYHYDKYTRGFKNMIDFWGADHGGYIKRMESATKAITNNEGNLSVKISQLVRFVDNGKEVKMSKRAGTFITVRDVIDKVGKDIIRFIMLNRKDDATLDFDFAKVIEESRENPVFYLQYALARTYSVLRQYVAIFGETDYDNVDYSYLNSAEEFELIKTLLEWPRQVELAALHREPHRITFFLLNVAAAFHSLWNSGKADCRLRFIDKDNPEFSKSKMVLVTATQRIIEFGLKVIGVTALKELR